MHELSVWNKTRVQIDESWKIRIPSSLIAEWKNYFDQSRRNEVFAPEQLRRGELSLPGLIEFGTQINDILFNGVGFVLLEGFSAKEFSESELRLAYLTICLQLGEMMELYGRLYDVKTRPAKDPNAYVTISNSNGLAPFHTDGSWLLSVPEVVGLQCLQRAVSGGENLLVSAAYVHEKMRREKPDILECLYQPFIRYSASPGHEPTCQEMTSARYPVFSFSSSGMFQFRYMRRWIEEGHKKTGIELEPASINALDYLDRELENPEHVLQLALGEGDILFTNNLLVAHTRTPFVEDLSPGGKKRLMVRAWMTR